jgi:hypothetical protein
MDLTLRIVLGVAELLDHLPRFVALVRLTPSRRARAAEEGWSVAFMRRVDWNMSGGRLASSLVTRLGSIGPCGCRLWNTTVVLYDIDCVEHDAFGMAG